MAYTKVFAIRNRLDKRVNYAVNGDKTILDDKIEYAINYAINPEKTEEVRFVDALNCDSIETAFDEMRATKQKFKKTGGVLGYHFIQSFAPGEVTPEQAHKIGVEFARRMFGDQFEVVIGTHLDKAHPHNHIIVNSVSFVDGHKYHSSPESYFKEIRATSDALCRENDLSVIAPQGKGKHYGEWKAEQDGKPTIRGMIRADMDAIIAEAYTLDTFFMLLERKGYTVHRRGPHRKYTTVQPKGAKRAIRLSSLGDEYTEEGIKARLAKQRLNYHPVPTHHTPKKRVKRYRVRGLFFYAQQPKITGFLALYLRYLYLLRRTKRRKQPYRAPFPLRQEAAKFERYQAQFKYLLEQNIKTADELEQRIAALEGEIAALTEQRKPLYQQRKEATDEEAQEQLSAEIDRHTAALREKRRELALCRRIQADIPQVSDRLRQAREDQSETVMKEEKQHEYQRRNR
ncbi:MAG: relaxase/mobilization nuclease domain-containing protein [Oscillospiraceae bacterium]|nr:relaxase/mobilization nuclease domain-containing protein [Oscillospiraceae bacterium]